ncbi:stealth family protein [Streptomyces sp. NPDC058534]|uniref:stealth family protein n=1 Tax=Streptomyces sp. NPDC058534 TaxID=3346541 RepID=UPI0036526BA1
MTINIPAQADARRAAQLQAPPPSLMLRTYRRLLPLRMRRAVRARFGVEQWERLRQRLERPAALVHEARHRWLCARLNRRGLLRDGERVPVQTAGGTRIALLREGVTPLLAREHNLRLVLSALEEAGVEHFVVRNAASASSAVGISSEDRAAAETALIAMGVDVPAYLTRTGGSERVRDRRAEPAGSRRSWHRAADRKVIRIFCYLADAAAPGMVLGSGYGCDIEVWRPSEEGAELVAPRRNRTCERVCRVAPVVEVPGRRFTRLASEHTRPQPATVRTRREFAEPVPDDIDFPVDAVYTWVDGSDPEWQRRRATVVGEPYHPQAANAARYLSRDELRYSLRSLHMHAPWIRHVYLVTDQQVPAWLDTGHPRLTVVDHREIFTDPGMLPTFNSHAIESQLHHIEGLAEQFLYFNDDVFLGRPTVPQQFFLANGISRFFLSKALLPPVGSAGADDVPVSAAALTNRRLLQARFGSSITQKMKHTPCALRRSVLAEIEQVFAEDHRRTAAHAFRGPDDISITNSLHHYYAFHTGRAVPGGIRYDYIDIAQPGIAPRLRRLLAARSNVAFCLNDTVTCDAEGHTDMALVQRFLDDYFPTPSPFEHQPDHKEALSLPCPSPSGSLTIPASSRPTAPIHARSTS